MLITEKIEKYKKFGLFFKNLRQFFSNLMTLKQLARINGLNKVLITEKIKKITKNCVDFFQSLRQFSVKFNDPEAISKQLTLLIKC